jgi:hypothetical protein
MLKVRCFRDRRRKEPADQSMFLSSQLDVLYRPCLIEACPMCYFADLLMCALACEADLCGLYRLWLNRFV